MIAPKPVTEGDPYFRQVGFFKKNPVKKVRSCLFAMRVLIFPCK